MIFFKKKIYQLISKGKINGRYRILAKAMCCCVFLTNIIVLCFVCSEEDFPDPSDESAERSNKPGQDLITVF